VGYLWESKGRIREWGFGGNLGLKMRCFFIVWKKIVENKFGSAVLSVTFVLQRCYMARKKTKICLVCGKDFLGSEAAFTCGTACRTYMSRLVKKGKKPEYYFVAKGKGQKVPDFKKEVAETASLPETKETKIPEPKEEKLTAFQIYQRTKLGLK